MPKTKRLVTYYGAILEPLCQYVMKVDVVVTPFDKKGNGIGRHMYTFYKGGSSVLKQLDSKVNYFNFTKIILR